MKEAFVFIAIICMLGTQSYSACTFHKSLVLHGFGMALYSDGLVKIEMAQSCTVILSAADNGGHTTFTV